MAKLNFAYFYGRVAKDPDILNSPETGAPILGMLRLDVVRGRRDAGDDISFLKHDIINIVTRDEEYALQMQELRKNDNIIVKGVITTSKANKPAPCPYCKESNGPGATITYPGLVVYVTPVFIEKIRSFDEKTDAIKDLSFHKEISNQVYVCGTVLKDPKFITTKKNTQITQYPLAINRKYTIRMDDPSIKTDYPMVKSYGEQARDDKAYLQFKSEVLIDGFLQTRTTKHTRKCPYCQQFYSWTDKTNELVPYATEYIDNFKTQEDIEREFQLSVEAYKQKLFDSGVQDTLDEYETSEDIAMENKGK